MELVILKNLPIPILINIVIEKLISNLKRIFTVLQSFCGEKYIFKLEKKKISKNYDNEIYSKNRINLFSINFFTEDLRLNLHLRGINFFSFFGQVIENDIF